MMQRFNIVSIEDGFYRHEYSEAGPYLLYSDAHALEVRNQELVAAITRMLVIYDTEEFAPRRGIVHGISVGADVCNQARKALAQTEGA